LSKSRNIKGTTTEIVDNDLGLDTLIATSVTPVTLGCARAHQIPRLLLLVVRIPYCPPPHIQNVMTHTYQPRIFTIRTWAWWRLPRSEEEDVREGIRWAVRAFVREIRDEVRGNVRHIDWVVM
jgi:hypothetical protein